MGVILNHSNWHVLKHFTPGDVAGYPFLAIDQIGKMAIAAFLFIAGYFSAYATSGGKRDLPWHIIRTRILGILWPWFIWSALVMVGQSFQEREITLVEYVLNLFVQYYFIPLLIISYLLAPFVARWARSNPKALLINVGVIQLIAIVSFYLRVYWQAFPSALNAWVDIGPLLYLRFAIYFPLGLIAGMYPKQIKEKLAPYKSHLLWTALFFFMLSAIEAVFCYHLGDLYWPRGNDQTKLTSALFTISFVLIFVAHDRINIPFNKFLIKIGTHSYGLYLSHYVILGVLAKIVYGILPDQLAVGWLVLPTLFFGTATSAMLIMELVARSPAKRMYHYLFG